MADRWIAGGARCEVWAGTLGQLGMVTNASYDEDFAVTPAAVVGYLGPADYDSQGYSCTITLGTFVPAKPGTEGDLPGGGTLFLADLLPTREEVQNDEGRPGEFDQLTFQTKSQVILAQFEHVMIASNGVQIAPNSFVTANIRLMAVSRIKAPDAV